MSEGGRFPWRVQKIFKLPTADYTRLRESLPATPKGMEWVQDEKTKQWRLVKQEELAPALIEEIEQEKKKQSITTPTPVTPEHNKKKKENNISDSTETLEHHNGLPRSINNNNNEIVDQIPNNTKSDYNKEEDWELLSDRLSATSSTHTPGVIIQRSSGSVRSLTSMEGGHSSSHASTQLSIPFKIQRTASSSTIDSSDGVIGPSGKGVLGVDYVEHVIMPSDTLQGICLAYKISTTKLRQANCFSGNSLLLAPKKLVIPISKTALRSGFIRIQETDSREYKLHAFLAEFPDLSMVEAKAYLELADWDLKDAIRSAKDDYEWEKEMESCSLRSGEIRITPKLNKGIPIGFDTEGAGIQPKTTTTSEKTKKEQKQKTKVTAYDAIPAIATKTVNAQDVYLASPQHDNFGVEMQSIDKKMDNNEEQNTTNSSSLNVKDSSVVEMKQHVEDKEEMQT